MKKKLKDIIASPVNPVHLGTDIKVSEQKNFDLSHLTGDQLNEVFRQINKLAKNHKSKGVIVTKGGQDQHTLISIQLNSAANKKNVLSFPEPALSRIYYRISNEDFEYAIKQKNKLMNVDAANYVEQYNIFVQYLRFLSTGCVMTISSLEAFMNSHIPFDFTMEIGEEFKEKSQLEYLDFNTKVTLLMPALFGKSFHKEFPEKYASLSNCNSLRDDFIHPKKELNENKTIYEVFFKRAFDAKIEDFSNAAFDFVNYYIDNYFEELTDDNKP